jgi:hypothetical protein
MLMETKSLEKVKAAIDERRARAEEKRPMAELIAKEN